MNSRIFLVAGLLLAASPLLAERQAAVIDPQTNLVVNVIVIPDNTADVKVFCATLNLGAVAVEETFTDEVKVKPPQAFKNYAAIGATADKQKGGFIAPKPDKDATLDPATLKWQVLEKPKVNQLDAPTTGNQSNTI